MRMKKALASILVAGMMALTACTTQSGPDYTVWIPDHSISDLELGDDTITTQSSRVIPSQEEYTSVDEIAKKSGAMYKIGKVVLVEVEPFEAYIRKHRVDIIISTNFPHVRT